jgi:hypothetical protein
MCGLGLRPSENGEAGEEIIASLSATPLDCIGPNLNGFDKNFGKMVIEH